MLIGSRSLTVLSAARYSARSATMAAVSVAPPNRSDASPSTSSAAAAVHEASAGPHKYAHVTFPLPEKRYVGMLHCQRDPLAATLVTRVLRCDKVRSHNVAGAGASGGPNAKAGKAKAKATKKGASAPPEAAVLEATATAEREERDEWELELADTVLFPEGGGQPSDTGRIVPLGQQQPDSGSQTPPRDSTAAAASSMNEAAVVRQVIRRNLDAVHFVSKPVEVGTEVRVEVDMDRRRDLMDQHTGQHVRALCLLPTPAHESVQLTHTRRENLAFPGGSSSRGSSNTNSEPTPSRGRCKSSPN